MESLVCLDCGFVLGAYREAFLYMKEIYLTEKNEKNKDTQVHVDKKFIYPDSNDDLRVIFDYLKINRICCRGQMVTSVTLKEISNLQL